MDAANLAVGAAIAVVAFVFGRGLFASLETASDCMSSLFVPPSHDLGWPHGVQERDDPWAWRAVPPPNVAPRPGPVDDDVGGTRPEWEVWIDPRRGAFVVPIGRVAPVQLGVRPH